MRWTAGPECELAMISLGVFVLVSVIASLHIWRYWRTGARRLPAVDPRAVESCQTYRRYLAAAAAADGSRRSWDYAVRPVLVELALVKYSDSDVPNLRRSVVERILGDELWRLVDPDVARSQERSVTGSGRADIVRILDALENS